MAVFRVNKTKDYTVMSNQHLKDKNLSLKAIGLLSRILSLPDDWDYSINGLVRICKEEQRAVTAALDELKQYGYLVVRKVPPLKGNNKFSYVYDIYENPQNVGLQNVELQVVGVQGEGLQNVGANIIRNPSNTKEQKTKERNTKTYKGGPEKIIEEGTGNEELRGALSEFMQFRKDIRKPLTEHALKLLISKLQKMGRTDAERVEILNQSMVNGWQGIYEVKKDDRTGASAYRGHSTGKYKPVGSGEIVL